MTQRRILRKKTYLLKAVVFIAVAATFIMLSATFLTSVKSNELENHTPEILDNTINPITDVEKKNIGIKNIHEGNPLPLPLRNTIYVDDNADPSWYDATHVKTIQEGINNATVGDTVYVYNGMYREHVIVNKTINLIGENKTMVIINGTGTGKVLYVKASNVTVSYFTIIRGQYGIHLDTVSHCTFNDLNVMYNQLSSGAWGFYANSANFTQIIGGNYSRNGNTGSNQHGYNIYFTTSQNVTINGAIVYEPVQGPKPPTCPILYSWSGSKFTFEGDGSINGGMGFRNVIEQKSQPFDYIVANKLEPQEGTYKFVVAEEQKEILYFDSAKLLVIDHEPGVRIFSPTPIYIAEPQIENPVKIHTVRNPQPPVSAYDENGNDILEQIKYDDNIYTTVATPHHHDQITLNLGNLSSAPQIKLLVKARDTWVNQPPYDYSFIEVVDGNGDFVRVNKRVDSFPEWSADNTRTFVLDISDIFLTNNYTIRLNLWHLTYFDYIAVDTSLDVNLTITELTPKSANLFYKGLSKDINGVFDYYNISPDNLSEFTGNFTRYGDVTELVQASDDMYIIANPGDAINLSFDAIAERKGMERSYVLISDAFYKVDWLKGLTGQQFSLVTPLPFHGMLHYPYNESDIHNMYPLDEEHINYLNQYNTRYLSYSHPGRGHITNQSAYGIYLYKSNNATINNVSGRASHAQTGNEYGIYLTTSNNAKIINIAKLTNWEYGILLYLAKNCSIINNTLYGNTYGFYLQYCDNNNIADSVARNNQYGMFIDGSSGCIIKNSRIYNNTKYGIYLYTSTNTKVINNVMTNNGIVIDGTSEAHWMHNIDSTNTANSKPIYYYKNQTGGSVPSGAGQVILVNCSSMDVENQNISNVEFAITLAYSSSSFIKNSNVHNNYNYGIYLYSSPGNTIINCTSYKNTVYSIYLFKQSSNNKIIRCDSRNTTLYIQQCNNVTIQSTKVSGCTNNLPDQPGLLLRDTTNSSIVNCTITKNAYGIMVRGASTNNRIMNCTGFKNERATAAMDSACIHNRIINCTLYDNSRFGFWTQGAGYNTLDGCIIHDNGYAYSGDYQFGGPGVILHYQTVGNTVENCTIYNNYEGIVVFDVSCSAQTLRNNEIYNNTNHGLAYPGGFTRGDLGHGIYIMNGPNQVISNNNVHNNAYGIFIGASSGTQMNNNTMRNNTYGFGLATYTGVTINSSNTINGRPMGTFTGLNNTVFDTNTYGWLRLISCNNITVKNIDIEGILVLNTPRSTILNVHSHNAGKSGIHLISCPNSTVTDCKTYWNAQHGICLETLSNSNITNCTAYDNGWGGDRGAGIYINSCTHTNIQDCEVYNQSNWNIEHFGIKTTGYSYSTIKNCKIHNNMWGLTFWQSSTYNNIVNCDTYNNNYSIALRANGNYNNITDCEVWNSQYGLYFYGFIEKFNNIYNNDIYHNTYGIYSRTGNTINNTIYHNNVINNTQKNAYDEGINKWDNGYPSGGNFWNNYNGSDSFSGPGQNISGSDGIGDTPYNITGHTPPNKDRYPLMVPILASPELLSPSNGSYTENRRPIFDWNDVKPNYQVSYTLLVATDPGFTSLVINQTSLEESKYTPTANMTFDTFYWKVRAKIGNYRTGWSETWNVTIALDLTPPTTPELIEPANNSTQQLTPTIFFDWTDAYDNYGIDYYTFQVATDKYFTNIVFNMTSIDSDYTLTLMTTGSYYWRVRSIDNNGLIGQWSQVWKFYRLTDTTPPEIELLHPVGGEYLRGEVIILWNATDDVTLNIDLPITIKYRCGGPWQILASDEINDGAYLWNTTGYPDGTIYLISISTEDFWGNKGSDESYTTFTLDNTAPETTAYLDPATPDGENNWYVSNVRITLITENTARFLNPELISVEDTYTMYKIDDGNWQKYFVPFTVIEDGNHTVQFYSVDKAGNIEPTNTVSFNIDKTAPQFIDYTFTPLNLLKNKWLCAANVTDATSGIVIVEFYIDNILVGNDTTAPYEFQYNGRPTTSSQAIAYDAAGNSAMSLIVSSSVYTPNSQQQNYYPSMQILIQSLHYRQIYNME